MSAGNRVLRRRLLVGTVAVLIVLVVATQAEAFFLRRQIGHLVDENAEAQSHLTTATAAIADARAEQVAADRQVEHARGELDRASALLVGAGLERRTMAETERQTSEWLGGVEQLRADTQGRADELAAGVLEAKRCVDDGLKVLTNATTGGGRASQDTSCQPTSSGDATARASPAR